MCLYSLFFVVMFFFIVCGFIGLEVFGNREFKWGGYISKVEVEDVF